MDRIFPRFLAEDDLQGITDAQKTQLKIMKKILENEEEKERQKMIKEGQKKKEESEEQNNSDVDEGQESDEGLS